MTEYDNWTKTEKHRQEKARQLQKMKFTRDNGKRNANTRKTSSEPQGSGNIS
jgi:hypothetical protein